MAPHLFTAIGNLRVERGVMWKENLVLIKFCAAVSNSKCFLIWRLQNWMLIELLGIIGGIDWPNREILILKTDLKLSSILDTQQFRFISELVCTPSQSKPLRLNRVKSPTKTKKVWRKKEDNICLAVQTVLKVLDACLWYLDSGCSRQWTSM